MCLVSGGPASSSLSTHLTAHAELSQHPLCIFFIVYKLDFLTLFPGCFRQAGMAVLHAATACLS